MRPAQTGRRERDRVSSLALAVLQVEVRVEVDEDALVLLRGLHQPLALLGQRVVARVTGRRQVAGVGEEDASST